MAKPNSKLTTAVEIYFEELRLIRATGGGTGERSSYAPLANLLNVVGASLKPKVFCVSELADQGAGHPDFGLYEAKQVQKGRPRQGQTPERGVVEVKTPAENMGASQVRGQVVRYLNRYSLVLTTNLREFALVGPDAAGFAESMPRVSLPRYIADFESPAIWLHRRQPLAQARRGQPRGDTLRAEVQ